MKLYTDDYTLSSYTKVDFRLDLSFEIGVIDGFVAGGDVSSVAKVFRPEKAYLT